MNRLDYLFNDTGIRERAYIAQLVLLTSQDLTQNSAHNLARTSLWQIIDNNDALRSCERSNCFADLEDQFLGQLRSSFDIIFQGDKRVDSYCLEKIVHKWRFTLAS